MARPRRQGQELTMPQSADRVLDHGPLFREPEYQELFERKREGFECPASAAEVEAQREYTKSWEYRISSTSPPA
jgi:nitrogenase molybdenum-iron protein beta chain